MEAVEVSTGLWRQSEVVWSMVAQGVAAVSPYTALLFTELWCLFQLCIMFSLCSGGGKVRRTPRSSNSSNSRQKVGGEQDNKNIE